MTNPGEFKLVPRPDGTLQLTANGHPLYRYSGDTSQGQTNGQGVGGQWFVAGADGSPITG
jgi:predicted lipoprotein with Yx(FWY)xxD motif